MLYKSSLLCGSILFLAACTHSFQAASPVQSVPGSPHIARAAAKGLTMTAEVDNWQGDPSGLNSVLTPVKVSLNNEGDHPVSLRYKNFELSDPQGVRTTAIPPFQISGSTDPALVPIAPMFTYRSFYPYPYFSFYGPGFGYWVDNWGWDGAWYNSSYRYWGGRDLPTADMVRKAIPEGVLNPGGEVSGFLYFQRVSPEANTLDLQATLVDAMTHDQLAELRLPFVRK
jgi:hypothetical protein